MAYTKNVWNRGDKDKDEDWNRQNDSLTDSVKYSHMEEGIEMAHQLAEAAQKLADENKVALAGKANSSSLTSKADKSAVDDLAAAVEELQQKVAALEEPE